MRMVSICTSEELYIQYLQQPLSIKMGSEEAESACTVMFSKQRQIPQTCWISFIMFMNQRVTTGRGQWKILEPSFSFLLLSALCTNTIICRNVKIMSDLRVYVLFQEQCGCISCPVYYSRQRNRQR